MQSDNDEQQPSAPVSSQAGEGRFDWRWMLGGVLLLVGGNLGAWRLCGVWLQAMVERGNVIAAFGLAAAIPLAIYFVGGLLVGRLSRGVTCREPAAAAVVSVVVIFVADLLLGLINVFGLLIGAPFCYGASYVGGCLGERWQRSRRSDRQLMSRSGSSASLSASNDPSSSSSGDGS